MLGKPKHVENISNDLEVEELANFAVTEHNNQTNTLEKLTFSKVVSAKKQVVQGTIYHLTIEVQEAGNPKLYDAKVWVKPWENFKKLEDFKPAPTQAGFTTADLGVKKGVSSGNVGSHGPAPGLQTVPANDPVVREAAEHVVNKLQQGSNSLSPFELSEVVSAQAEVKEEITVFELVVKTTRGVKEEHFKSEVQRTVDGVWSVKGISAQ